MASSTAGFVHQRVADSGSANWASPKCVLGFRFGSSIRFSRKQNFGPSSIRFSRKENLNIIITAAVRDGGGADDDVSPPKSPPPPPSPWLVLPPSLEKEMYFNFYMLAEDKVVKINSNTQPSSLPLMNYVGSSHGWLAYNHYEDEQFICNPLTRRHIYLPSIQSLPVETIYPDYNFYMSKLILSRSPDDVDEEDDCIAMISYDDNERLAFCRLSRRAGGSGDTEWTPIGKPYFELDDKTFKREYQDFVYSAKRKLFFCVTQYAEIEAWDLRDPRSPPKMIPLDFFKPDDDDENHPWGSVGKLDECELKEMFDSVKYLVLCEQTDQLFLVRRYVADRKPAHYHTPVPPGFPYSTISFDVYEIDIEKRELRYMESSLNGLAMFIGINHGFAIQGGNGINPDSIYFTDAKEYTPDYLDEDSEIGGHDIGVFDYAKRDFAPCYNYPIEERTFSATLRLPRAASGANKIKRIEPPPMWFTPSTSFDT